MNTEKAYEIAREQYAALGVDTEQAMKNMEQVKISIHVWQGDDVTGFEDMGPVSGGIQSTGNYPGKASNADELRADLNQVFSYIPGKHKLALHAIYAETDGKCVERDELEPKYFARWVDWAKENHLGLDMNPTFFSHPKSDSGFTLSSADEGIRKFWVDHGIACRKIGEYFGRETKIPCVTNYWIPDGFKDIPIDRYSPRLRLKQSLDEIFSGDIDEVNNKNAMESKLFGLGLESYTVGSNEFYMGYAVQNKKLICFDTGHFHPTEMVYDKLSAAIPFTNELLLHVSRPVRWDSDHVVILNDEIYMLAQEIVRNNFLKSVHVGLDFFDGSINRIAAWTIGTRNVLKAFMAAFLEPVELLKKAELEGDYTTRLAMLEELKTYPMAAVWDYYCEKNHIPVGTAWLKDVKEYEKKICLKRNV